MNDTPNQGLQRRELAMTVGEIASILIGFGIGVSAIFLATRVALLAALLPITGGIGLVFILVGISAPMNRARRIRRRKSHGS